MASKKTPSLSVQETRFIDAYLSDPKRVGYLAAERAGYKNAHVAASRLLSRDKVQAEIARRMAPAVASQGITQEKVLAEIARIAFLDTGDLFTEGGNLLLPIDMKEDVRRAIAGIEVQEKRVNTGKRDKSNRPVYETQFIRKVKAVDKLGALKILAAHVGIATDRQEHTGAGGAPLIAPQVIFKAVMGPGKPAEATSE